MDDDAKTPTTPLSLPPTHARGEPPSSVSVDLSSLSRDVRPEYLAPGTDVRGWRVVDRLGAGGMGAVYKVQDVSESPPLVAALKVSLPPPDESEEGRAARVTRFEREAGVILQLSHPNIIKGLSYFVWPSPTRGHPCLVMPFVAGQTLTAYCRQAQPSLRVILGELLRPIADALDYIHAKAIFHRDIKPANIMVANGRPLLMDFGIARSRAAATLTSTEMLCTPDYTAPEHLLYSASLERAEEEVFVYTPQTDLFCLGATFFELLTGRLPYQHLPSSKAGFLDPRFQVALREFEPLRASECNPVLPPQVDELLGRLMSRQPDARFHSGAELAEAIDALLAALQGDAQLDAPFTPPRRLRTPSAVTASDRRRTPTASSHADGPAAPPPPPLSAIVPPSVALPSVDLPAPGAPSGGFRPPTAQAPRRFESPVAAAPAPASPANVDVALPTAIRRVREQLRAAPEGSGRNQRLVIGGLLGLVVLLMILVVASLGAKPKPAPSTSLLDAPSQDTPAPAHTSPVTLATPLPAVVLEAPQDAGVQAPPALAPPATVSHASVAKGARTDAAAVDAMLRDEYGGKRPVVGGGTAGDAPSTPQPVTPTWLKMTTVPKGSSGAPTAKAYGVPLGTEIAVRLQKPLDSRTVASGPVVARLMRPLVVRGAAVFSSGTMAYGTAAPTPAGRFDVRFTRLKLPDGTEVPFHGIAYDADDKKPGVRASSRIQSGTPAGPGLGEALAKGTANALLGKVPGGDVTDVAKGAGQTVVNHSTDTSRTGAMDALLLEAPVDFTIFVSDAF